MEGIFHVTGCPYPHDGPTQIVSILLELCVWDKRTDRCQKMYLQKLSEGVEDLKKNARLDKLIHISCSSDTAQQ